MLEKVVQKVSAIRVESQRKKEEENLLQLERIQAEKNALMSLSQKELIVEAVMALRGYHTRLTNLEAQQNELANRVDSIELDVTTRRLLASTSQTNELD